MQPGSRFEVRTIAKFDTNSTGRQPALLCEAVVGAVTGNIKCSRSQHPFVQPLLDAARPMAKIEGLVPLNQQWSLKEAYNLEIIQHVCANCETEKGGEWYLKDSLYPGLGFRCRACYN